MKKNTTKTLGVLLITLFSVIGAKAQTQIFGQEFNTGTDNIAANTYGILTSSNFVATSSPSSSQFTCGSGGKQSSSSVAVNNSSSGEFQAISGGTGFNWALTRNVNMASAPTALKIVFRAKFDVTSTSSTPKFYFMVGNGFTNEASGYTAVPSLPTSTTVNCGFSMAYAHSTNGPILYQFDGTTQMNGTTNITEAYLNYTMVINKSSSALSYVDTNGTTQSLSPNRYDLWLNTTRVGANILATNSANAINQFKFGDFNSNGRASVYLDYFRVYDITPVACSTPSITNPSTSAQSMCAGVNGTTLSVTGSGTGTIYYQWYKTTSNNNTSGTAVTSYSTTGNSYTPNESIAGTYYYYCKDSTGSGCIATSNQSGAYTVNATPTPTFSPAISGTYAINSTITYTTQASQSSYVWNISGTNGVDYNIVSGGTSSDNSAAITWLTAGNKTVTVGYTASGCPSSSPASSTITVSTSVFYNKPNSDITSLSNWGTATDGTGSAPANFIDAGQTFNLFNNGATMSTNWDVQGAGTKVVIGDGSSAIIFDATQIFTTTSSAVVDVANNASLKLASISLPTFGTISSGSTIEYTGVGQTVTATSYGNLTISGSSTTLTGTTNISGIFTPGTVNAGTSTIVLNGTSTSQSIPAFAYNNLTVSGVNGKSTSGAITVAGTLTMNNSFTIPSGSSIALASAATMASTAGTLTVNGTFQIAQNSVTFSAGTGNINVAAGGVFKMTGTVSNNALAFTNVNFTNGIGASGSTLYVATIGCPRLPATTFNGNVTYDLQTSSGVVNILNTSPITITGNMNILGTGGTIITQASGGSPRTLIVAGNLNMSGTARYDISANGATSGTSRLLVTGNVSITGTSDTLLTNNSSNTTVQNSSITIGGNLIHSAGILGRGSNANTSVLDSILFTGTSTQDISTIGFYNTVTTVRLNNSNGARLMSDLPIGGTLVLSNGKLRTNGYSVVLSGTTSTIAGASSSSYIANVDGSGTIVSAGGLTISNIGVGGRTTTQSFPIGTNTSYNPATVSNTTSAVSFTASVNNTPYAGTTTDSTVARTWNIQPSGSASAIIGLQWNTTDEGANFNRASASIAHLNGGVTDMFSSGGAAGGTNPWTLNSGSTVFTTFGDFGLIPGIIIPATEPTTQATSASVTATTGTTATLTWTSGNGTNSIVVIKQGSSVTANPVDGTSYADGSAVYASGTNLGSGNYVVYSGTGNSVTVTGLTIGTTYYFAVYSFNGSNGTENYLTSSATTANGTTTIPTYYYVGGAGNASGVFTNTFASSVWSLTLGGSPVTAFTPTANDVFIFDGSNLGGGYTDTTSIAPISSTTTVGKILLTNGAKVKILTNGSRTINIGNSAFAPNTTCLDIPANCYLILAGSTITNNLQTNSSANVTGKLVLGTGNNVQLLPGTSGSTISFNTGAYCESNQSSSTTAPFGAIGTNIVSFASGTTFKSVKGNDPFGGTGASVATFANGSLCWFNGGSSTNLTLDGRSFGSLQTDFTLSPTAGANGFTINNDLTVTAGTLTIAATGANNFIKGNINISSGATLKFNPASTASLILNGTSLQTITNNGTWSINSTSATTGSDQSFVINNSVGVSLAGFGTTGIGGLAGTSLTINSGSNLDLVGGTITIPTSGTVNINGTITRTGSGNINAQSSTSTVNITGAPTIPANTFKGDTVANLILNRAAGITFNGSINIITALTLTDGIINMGSNSMNIYAGKTLTRSNTSWINGTLRKNFSTGAQTRTFEIGDATNYLPVTIRMASVTTAGDLAVRTQTPATGYANFTTAPISVVNYINRYWTLTNVNTLSFTNYGASLNWVAGDIVGSSTSSTVKAVRYNSGWTKSNPTSLSSTSDSILAQTGLGTIILADDCITYTPEVSITSTTTAVCSGSSVTFTATPVNPGSAPSYQWKKNGTTNIGTNSTSLTLQDYEVTTGDVITCVMTANNVCQTANSVTSNGITLLVGTVTPSVSISTASSTVCSGNSVSFTANGLNPGPSPVYIWKKNGVSVGGGTSITFSPNTLTNGDVIVCELTANNPCQTVALVNSNSVVLTVQQSPSTPTVLSQYANNTTGFIMCALGSSVSLYPSVAKGVWSTTNAAVANVVVGGPTTSSAAVASVGSGTAIISYTLTTAGTSCTAAASITVKVSPQSTPAGISGPDAICVGSTATYTTTATGGVWGSAGRVNINGSGVATALNAGSTSIKYTITNADGCSASSSKSITINALPSVPSINYASSTTGILGSGGYCKNKTFTLAGNPAGGVWSSTGAFAITSGGVVTTAASNGSGSVTYTYTNSNGCTNYRTINSNVVSCGSKGISSQLTNVSEQFVIYPNPAHTTINLNVDKLVGGGSIVVTDLYGKKVKQQVLSMGNNTIDVSNFVKGMYLLSIITEQGKQTKKVVVE